MLSPLGLTSITPPKAHCHSKAWSPSQLFGGRLCLQQQGWGEEGVGAGHAHCPRQRLFQLHYLKSTRGSGDRRPAHGVQAQHCPRALAHSLLSLGPSDPSEKQRARLRPLVVLKFDDTTDC